MMQQRKMRLAVFALCVALAACCLFFGALAEEAQCSHPSYTLVEKLDYVDMCDPKDNDTHIRYWQATCVYKCDVCGANFSKQESGAIPENHSWWLIEHVSTTSESYAYVDGTNHVYKWTGTAKYACDCGRTVTRAATEETPEAHVWNTTNGNTCTLCKKTNPCKHPQKRQAEEIGYPNSRGKNLGDGTHSLTVAVTTFWTCDTCYATWDYQKSTREEVYQHIFLNGYCEVCGVRNTCQHPEITKLGEVTEKHTYAKYSTSAHIHTASYIGEMECKTCGEYLEAITYKTEEAHTWTGQNPAKCTFCGETSYTASGKLATPKISSLTNTTTGVTIKWGKVTGAAKYRVFYKTSGGWKKLADTTSTSYTWKKAKSGTKYTFTVRCVDSTGKTYTSSYNKTGKSITYLAAPKISSVKASGTTITIKWGKVTGAAKYRVFYKTTGGWKKLVDTTSTSYTWKKAKKNTTYTFTVRCIDKAGTKYTSAYDTTGKSTSGTLATPKLSSVTSSASGITVKWGKVSGAEKYRVYYKTTGSWKKLADTTSTSYTWQKAKSGTKYTFTVRCINKAGTATTSSYDKTGKSITYIAAPKVSVSAGNDGITVKWGKVTGAVKYRVFYKTTGGWKKLDDTTSTSYIWTGAKAGTKYTFTVRCINKAGTSYTSPYDKTGKTITYTATPKISHTLSLLGRVTLTWGKVSGAENYRVLYKTGSGSWKKLDDTTSTSYFWSDGKKGTTYSFTVRCINSAGSIYTSGFDHKGVSVTVK